MLRVFVLTALVARTNLGQIGDKVETSEIASKTGKSKKAYKNQSSDTELFLNAIPPAGIEQAKASAITPAR